MTKHEILSLLREETEPNYTSGSYCCDIAEYFDYDQDSTYGRLNRLRKHGLVWRAKADGVTLYGITVKSVSRLAYFEENGCGRSECSLC